LENYADELKHNGYVLIRGNTLKELKLHFAYVINVGSKTTQLGLFNFRSFLNLGMLLKESERVVQNTAYDTAHDTAHGSDGIVHAAGTAHSDILTVLQNCP